MALRYGVLCSGNTLTRWQRQCIEGLNDVPQHWRDRIAYFFEHYKDLESGKWVKLDGWGDVDEAKQILVESIQRYNTSEEKPNF